MQEFSQVIFGHIFESLPSASHRSDLFNSLSTIVHSHRHSTTNLNLSTSSFDAPICKSNIELSSEARDQSRAEYESKNNLSSLDSGSSSILLSNSMLSAGLDSSYISGDQNLDFSLVRDVMYKYSKRTQ